MAALIGSAVTVLTVRSIPEATSALNFAEETSERRFEAVLEAG
jgi:hypothetical protein